MACRRQGDNLQQIFVGLGDTNKHVMGLLIAWIHIRMPLTRKPPIGGFQLVHGSGGINPKQPIAICNIHATHTEFGLFQFTEIRYIPEWTNA